MLKKVKNVFEDWHISKTLKVYPIKVGIGKANVGPNEVFIGLMQTLAMEAVNFESWSYRLYASKVYPINVVNSWSQCGTKSSFS